MSWLNPFGIFTGGIDVDAEAQRTRELNAKKEALDAEAYKKGIWTAEDARFVEAQRASDAAAWNPDRYGAEVRTAAAQGAVEGLDKMQQNFRDTLGGAATFGAKLTLGWIPWWIWLGGALYAAWRLGLLAPLLAKGRLAWSNR